MEELLKKLKEYSRFLELEDGIPYWESQIPELEDRSEEMKWNLQQKELELLQLQEPGFFQRMFGRAKEKKEKLSHQIREINTANVAARWELGSLRKKIMEGKREIENLAGSAAVYQAAKGETVLTIAQESRLMMEEIAAFGPLALETAWRAMMTLEDARPWIRSNRILAEGSRKMEPLYRAQNHSRHLLQILAALPEGIAYPDDRLKNLYDYICGATSEEDRQNRLEDVQIQLRTIRNQLKQVLGE